MGNVIFSQKDGEFLKRLEKELKDNFSGRIAVKMHMGEPEGKYYLKPGFVKKVVDVLKKIGCEPFLFDSPVKYNSPRNTVKGYLEVARKNGFTQDAVGCPVVVSNNYIEVQEPDLKIQACRPLIEADGVLVLTHFKGHSCSGAGGSIKNLGMGAVTRESKKDIHNGSMPVLNGDCKVCKICMEVCGHGCISYGKDGFQFDEDRCAGCSKCIQNCPEGVLEPRVNYFDNLLAQGAHAAWRNFKNAYCVNVIRDISKKCDCNTSKDNTIVLDDVGIVMGKDIVSVDKASHDRVKEKAGKDIFRELNHKTPVLHMKTASELGMGSLDYEVRE